MDYSLRVEYLEYVVKKGDSLYTIARKFNTTVSELTDINMLTNNVIYPNQVLLVPKVNNDKVATDYYFEEYITVPNDTIESISKKFGVDTVTLGLYNDFGKLGITGGQSIKVPLSNIYIVKNNDSVDSILSKTNRTAEQILKSNSNEWLKVGSKIYL